MSKSYHTYLHNRLLIFLFVVLALVAATPFVTLSQVFVPFATRTTPPTYKIRGDFAMIGNTNLTLQNYGNNTGNQNEMIYVDIDGVDSTFNSSAATLQYSTENGADPSCTDVLFAGLYWTGRTDESSNSPWTFDVTEQIQTGTTTVNQDYTVADNDNIPNTGYDLQVTRGGPNGNRYPIFTFSDGSDTYVFNFTNNTGANRVTLSVNGGGAINIPVTYSVVGGVGIATLVTPYVITIGGVDLTIIELRRDPGTNLSTTNTINGADADVNVSGDAPTYTNYTKTFDKRQIKLKGPGATDYTLLSASEIYFPLSSSTTDSALGMFAGFVDVTSYVATYGAGEYTVADIALREGTGGGGTGLYGGWGMVVVYQNYLMTWRDITIFDGHAYVPSGTAAYQIPVTGFQTTPAGAVNLRVGVMAGEGDAPYGGDYFQIRNAANTAWVDLSHAGNTTTNFFNSSIETGGNPRNPTIQNNTGVDVSAFSVNNPGNTVMANNQTSTTFRYGTTLDTYIIFNITVSSDSYVPEVESVISVTELNGSTTVPDPLEVAPGDLITYTIDIYNTGNEDILGYLINVPMSGLGSLVPGSLSGDIYFTPLPTPNDLYFSPDSSEFGSIIWDFGTLPLPADPTDLLATLTYTVQVIDNCIVLNDANCADAISTSGTVAGQGSITGVALEPGTLVTGYEQSGPCGGEPIYDPLVADIVVPPNWVEDNCSEEELQTDWSFCFGVTDIPLDSVNQYFPAGTRFYDEFPITGSTTEFTTTLPATEGAAVTYYGVPSIVEDDSCAIAITITLCLDIDAVDDYVGSVDCVNGETNLLNVLSNDDLGGSAPDTSDVELTIITPDPTGYVTINPDGSVDVAPNLPAATYTVTYQICEHGFASNCDQATLTITDVTAPTAICQDLTVQLDGSGNVTVLAGQVDNGSSDDCGIASLSLSTASFSCSDVGANSVTLTVTDGGGNTDDCTATITVQDTEDPTAICQDITVQLDGSGNASIVAADVDNGSNDNCSVTLSATPLSFTCANTGANTITLTATDPSGNTDQCTSTVTIEDNVDPTAICQDITVQLDATGNASIVAADVDNGSNDNCSVLLSATPLSFTCANTGANTITLTVTDSSGNTDNCTSTVTIEDNINPTAICQDITVQLDASGNASIVAADVDNGSNDNCSVTLSATPLSFTCANTGTNTITLTATDPSGNSDNCTSTVTLQDTVSPTALCQDVTLSLNSSGSLLVFPADVDNGSNDACGISGMFANPAAFDCSDTGANTVTLTVTDNNGNQSTCTSTVTIVDDEDPTAICQDITVQLDATGNASIVAADVDNGSNDNCSVTLSATPLSFTCANVGSNTITLTVTDPSGNTDNCTSTVTIEDNIDPTAICQDITVQLDASGNASIVAADVDNGSNDNCSVTLSAAPLLFTCANTGANTVTLTVTDPSGNTDVCTSTVTIEDNIDPTAICQDITVQLDASGNASIVAADVDNGSNDNCSVTLSATPLSFTCAETGANTITLTVTDPSGNTDVCTSTVTIEDNIDPTAICQDITVQLDASGNASIVAADVDNGSNDNCSVTLSATPLSFTCANTGSNTVTLTVTDPSGNTDNCTSTVTIEDNIDPTAICQDITVQLDASGNASIVAADVDNGSNDNCSVTLSATPLSFTCANTGSNTVTLTVTDPSGNTDVCTSTVTIEDNIDPTAICQDITVQLDASGNASIVAADVDNGSNDNCSVSLSATPLSFTCANTGSNTITLTVTDPSGNTDNCTSTVTIEDNIDPTAICQDITVQLDATGNASIVAADVDNGSNDNCSVTLSATPLSFTCANTGSNTITLTVTDPSGNTNVCTSTVTIEDNIDPTAICQDITVQLDATGNASIVAADVDNGSNDNCSVSLSATPLSFTCANTGSNTITLTVTDPSGNTDNCTSTVTIEDNTDPTAICQDITVQLDASGNASIVAADVDNGSNDNCSVSLSASPTTFTCANTGSNTVTLTVTDPSGNTDQCTSTVTIEDNIDPTAICQDITVQLDATGNASIVAADVDNGSNDNCSVSLSATPLSFTCANTGTNTVTLTVTDPSGNTDQCTSTVTIEDNIDPTAICQDITVQLDASGNASIVAADVDNGSNDNCSVTLSATPLTFTCSEVGTNAITLTATDPSGNTDDCIAAVTIQDTVNPIAVCQDITVQLDASGNATISATDIDNGSSDNCSIASLVVSPNAFDCSNVGSNTVTLTVTDVNGNTATCTATVTVEDNINPTAVCQDITVQLDANGDLTIVSADIDGGSTDNCGIASLTIDGGNTSQDFDCSDVGSNTVTLTVTDVNGNVSTCDAIVTVEDNVDPSAVCQDITVYLDGNGDLTIASADIDGGSSDACGIASLTIDGGNTSQDFDCSNVGSNTVTLTVTDVNGNVSTCDATVTVQDTVSPVAVCQDITVQLDAAGNLTIVSADIDGGSSDNCGIASLTIDGGNTSQDFDCSQVGANTVTLTVTDVNGNTSTCDATVTVEDNVDPTAVCQDITVQLDAAGDLTVTSADIDGGSTDNCGIASLEIDGGNLTQDFDCSSVGTNTVTLTVTDVNGNVSTCDATVTVEDNVDPTAVCQDITIQLDANGDASISTVDIDNGSTDNCGIASITLDGGASSLDFDCSNVGTNTVTLTVTDVNGNVSTCTATVTVQDTIDPTAVCQDITIQLDANGDASISTVDIDNGSTDNCGIASITLDGGAANLDFDCSNVGTNTVTLTITDVNGNVSTCTATVTVEDNIDPTAVCQDITIQLDANGDASISTVDINNGSTDNCGIASITLDGGASSLDFDCSNVGTNTVTLTVTDVNGNVSTCAATVTVEDNVDPSAVCQDITVQLDANGDLTIVSADIDGGSSDACGIASLTIDGGNTSQDFDCSSVGTNTVTLTVTDVNGNVSTCDATVTVQDTVSPTAVCQDITVQLDASGNLTIVSTDIDGGSSDACGIASLTIDGGNTSQDFDCSQVGTNTVTLTVTDVNGNVSTCDATVTVQDTVSPTAVCQNITVYLDGNGDLTLASIDIDGGSSDNCGIASLEVDGGNASQDFDCSSVGSNTVTLTVTDVNGNVSTCDATVTVSDTTSASAVCQDITVQLDATGNVTITGADIDGGSTDNCGIATLSAGPNALDCSNVGTNTITLTITDVNGNVSTCDATVTVEDNVDPTATCQDITVYVDAAGDVTIVAADVDNGSTDNCGVSTLAVSETAFDCSDLGGNLVTLTVTDVNGNTATCTSTVTVSDTINPTAVCQDIIAELSAAGSVSVAAGDIDNGSFDNCAVTSITLSPNAFTCADVGINVVTLTVTDVAGNTSTCTGNVDVQDNVVPSAFCQDLTVQLDGAGNATITPVQVDNGSTDACGAVTPILVSPASFDCSNIGVNIVTLTVEDPNGNTSTCAATVTIQDTVSPIALCQDITVQLDGTGNASIVPADVDNGSSDNCAIDNMTVSPNSFTCAEEGPNTVTLTVTDVNGNVSTCTATVTVENNITPSVSCQDITVYLDGSGNTSITAGDVDGGSNAACGIASLTVSPSAFTCADVGANTVTLTGTDVSGNVSTCTAIVTVVDTTSPAALCQDITIQLDATGNASIVAADVDNGSTDNCAVASLSATPTAFDCSNVGANTVTLTVTDVNGNSSTCTSTVTVEDNIDPTIVCQDITVQLDATGNISIVAADIDNGTADNCSTVGSTLTLSVSQTDFDCSEVGVVTVTLTANDENGNSSTCTADVTVQDDENPNALCQNITVYLDGTGNASITAGDVDAGSTDNCGIASTTVSPNSFTCSGVGANPVTLTVTDVNGNVATCGATVTVLDTIRPNAVCQDITIQLDGTGNGSIVATQVNNGSTDECGVANLAVDISAFDCSNVGPNTVTLTVTDFNGNTSTCTSTVTVEDNVDPVAVCQDITIQLDAAGTASILASDIDNGSADNCAVASLDVNPNTFDCSNVGANTVTLTVTDVNGNTDNCTATVTVQDTIDPTALCQDITVYLDGAGNATITAGDIDNGSSDNCTIASLSASQTSFTCADEGANTVTLTVTDVNGNASTCTSTVTVRDTVSPNALCQNISVYLDGAGNAGITASDIDGGSADNCGIASLAASVTSFTCADVGANTVTLTVTDVNGNVSTCDATVTVIDSISPTAVCQDITVYLDGSGNLTIASADIDGGSADNCGVASLTIDGGNTSQAFDCSEVGANTVTLTVTDVNGNVSTCDATVTVVDSISPTAVCQAITVYLDGSGNLTITSADIDGGSADNCGVASLTIDGGNTLQTFDCSEVGTNTVTLTVTDVNGNVSTCDATVTVVDSVLPSAVCQDITVYLDGNGDLTIASADIDGGSADNCGIASLEIDNGNTTQAFDCSSLGTNTVTLTVTDVNGNVSTCDATVTVLDTVTPVIVCQDITVQLDANGEATITGVDLDGGTSDNCSQPVDITFTSDVTDFDCSNVGVNTVTLTATDANGNVSTCSADVTVQDTIDPTAVCQDITVYLDGAGNVSITAADVDGGSTDNCGIDNLAVSQDAFVCAEVGANTVTLTVTDVNGNVSTCAATVTVLDTVSPAALCQDITIQLDASGNATISATDVDNGSSDNCAIASMVANPNAFTCADEGANTVTLTVTDVNGNVSTCTSTVTVENNVVPNVVCQDITVYLDATGNVSILADDVNSGSNASCGLDTLTVSPSDFDCSNVGANTVTLTAIDNSGNVSTCDATVTVLDTISPTAVCQDITVYLDAAGQLTITSADVDGGSSDNCAVATLEIDNGNTTQDFDCSQVGTNTVTLTVTDVNGNVSTCDATVTVEDTISPTAVCQDITVQLDTNGQLTITSSDIDGGSNDNCGIASLEIDNGNTTQDFDCTTVGTNTVTLTVTDVNGNVSTCDATVTVEDTISPSAVCQDITVQLDANGQLTITSSDIDGGSNDNCGIASLEIDNGNTTQDFDCTTVGTNTVTLTVTDVNGNVSTCDAMVTVEDSISPSAVCQDITVQLDANGQLTITSSDIDGGSNDNCGIASLEIDNGNTTQDFDCTQVGTNTVTLTVTDVNGNISTCDATVTVEDTISPSAVCQDITVQLDANGELTITSADIDGGSNDNCGIASLEIDNGNTTQDFDCTQVGTNTVTLTVTDVNGNVSTCDATVTVEDTVSPTAVCQDITVQLDANGQLTITSADIDGGSNDNCGIASLEIDNGNTTEEFDCTQVGTNTVTLTVTDVNGNVSTCDATVTVEDTISPSAVCQDITVQLDANGQLTITSSDIDGGSNDNCGIASLEIDNGNTTQDFDCSQVGTNTVTLTVTDVNGNVSTCDATVTVEDTISPTIVCQDITIELDATGNVSLTGVELDGGTTDNCGTVTFDIDAQFSNFDCSMVGVHTVTLTATDANGNTSTCDAEVTVENNQVPTLTCQDITVYLDGTGNVGIVPADVNAGSNASCGLASLVVSPDAFDCSNIGANLVTLTATDSTGNVTPCNATVTVLDTISPTAVCNNITVDLDTNGDVVIDAADLAIGSSDNCGVASITVDSGQLNTTLDCSTIGANTVTVTVTDVNGNISTCDATVTVEDNTNPTASCASVTVQLDANGEAIINPVLVDNGSTDNCGIDSLSVTPQTLNCNNIGANSVVLTVWDVNGNISTCIATVTAQDTVSPTAVCTDIIVQLDGNGTAVIAAGDIDDGSYDNCGILSLAINMNSFDCSSIGGNTVELTVMDLYGNSSTCTSTATVVDQVDPSAVCQNISVYLDANGQVTIAAEDVDNGSTDACGIDMMTLNVYQFDCSDIGVNPVTLTVTDNYGNFDVCQAIVRVFDTIPPIATCTPLVVQLDAAGSATITPAQVNLNSSDNCNIDYLALDNDSFDCSNVGANTVELTVMDVNGNSSTCTATVIVEENVPPVALCQNLTIYLDAQGNASITAADVDAGSTDNCLIDTMYVTPNDFTCSGVGANPVVLTVEDANGNVSSCNATVTVIDTISPVAVCQNITVQLDANGNATIVAEEIDNGSNDACGIQGFTADMTAFDCSNVGPNTVTLTVIDNNGNTSTCTGVVTVEDNVAPTALCDDITVILDGNGTVNVSAGEIDGSSFDNCGIDSMYIAQSTFTCADLGANIINLTVVDVNGNTAFCAAEITVLDTLSPVIIGCPMDTVIVPDSSDCSPQVFWTEPTAQDNCTATLTSNLSPGDNFPVGTTTVTYVATDQSNNSTSCSFDVTIQPSPLAVDVTSPEGPCGFNLGCSVSPDGIAIANVSGGCMPYTYLWTDNQITQAATNLPAGLIGVTVTDANGNSVFGSITLIAPDPLETDSLVSPQFSGGANISCNGAFDGTIDFNVVGGEECLVYTYEWTGPNGFTSTDQDLTGLEAGTYVVVVTDASGCFYTDSVTLTEPAPLDVDSLVSDYNGVNISCGGAADGWIDLTISGGAAPYSVSWSNGEMTEDIDSLMAGIYTYTITDANGCTTTGSITLEEPDGLSSFITASDYNGYNISCFGLSDGSVDLTVNEGTQPYTFAWTGGFVTEDLVDAPAGTYVVTVTDVNGCSIQDSITLTQPNELVVYSVDSSMVSCNGADDGSFFVQAQGGVPTYTFAWSDGQMGPTAEELGPGTYTVVVTDQNSCQDSITLDMTEPDVLDISVVEVQDVVCFGESNGTVDVSVVGGTEPYTYDWSNSFVTEDLNGVPADTYVLEVTDANGCTDTVSVVVNEPPLLALQVDTVINSTCSGASDGEITVEAVGGTAPFIYTWPAISQSGPTASNLAAGVYEVNVVDANGCTATLSLTVSQPTSISAQVAVQSNVSCNGLSDASALVTASGGTAPYSYLWSNNDMDSLGTGFPVGQHFVTVTDAAGCDTTLFFNVTEPDVIAISLSSVDNVSCNGLANGQIEVAVAGGTTPYTVTWSNADVGNIADNLPAGTHTVYVEDANGCQDSLSTVISEPDTIQLFQQVVSDANCAGSADGEATVLVTGGTPPFTYAWPAIGQTGNTATGLAAGTYTFVATDANNCQYTDTVVVGEPDPVIVTVTADTAVCPGSGVTISASATGGAGNYSYSWDNGLGFGASHFVSPSSPTTYSVQVFDQSGCPAPTASVTVNIATVPTAAFSSSAAQPCVLPTDISFTNTSSNATGYQWLFGNGSFSSDVNPTTTYGAAGTYTVTLIALSGAGCSDTTTGVVVIDEVPTVGFNLQNAQGCAPLVVNFNNTSSPGLQYQWNFGDGSTSNISNPIHVYDIPGDYQVSLIVTSSTGCSDTLTLGAGVSVYPSPIADFTANQVSFPEPGNEYEFVNNSVGASLYNWDFGNGDQMDDYQPIYEFESYGGYFVTLTAINEFGCADTAVHYVSVELETHLYVPNALAIGETGEAALFLPKGTGIADYHLWIFDNWGNQLWESTALINGSPAEGWDGRYRGQTVPQGSYVWKINAVFVDGEVWEGQENTKGGVSNTGSVMVLY